MIVALAGCVFALSAPPPLQAKREYLFVDRLLIGSLVGGKWNPVGASNGKPTSIDLERIGIAKPLGKVKATGLEHDDVTGGVFVMGSNLPEGVLFGGKATWPRPVKVLAKDNSVYLGVLRKFLSAHGVRSKARLTQAVAMDLDGDGTQEILLEASSRDDVHQGGMSASQTGDYSLVLLRHLKGGRVVDVPIDFDHPKQGAMMYRHTLRSVADFDGDGVMEFVVTSDYYEGGGSALMRYRRGKVKVVVTEGAGV